MRLLYPLHWVEQQSPGELSPHKDEMSVKQVRTNAKLARSATVEASITVTQSAVMHEALRKLEKVAQSDLSVIIYGEHGTGKEWAAHLVHNLSGRADQAFVTVDCAALEPEAMDKELFGYDSLTWEGIELKKGAFEVAAGGTLLLNEFTSLSLSVQMKIARALEYHTFRRTLGHEDIPITARTIATMSHSPEDSRGNHELSKELYHRIGVIAIALPPIRERPEDIPLLVDRFLADLQPDSKGRIKRMSPEALQICQRYSWPGNVRHLKNAVEYASIMCDSDVIGADHLPAYLHDQTTEWDPPSH
jgi:DNA-binding NtrC family response regulator